MMIAYISAVRYMLGHTYKQDCEKSFRCSRHPTQNHYSVGAFVGAV